MVKPPVFLDACVLYPNLVRGIVLRLAEARLFRPAWSPRVLMEWRIAAARNGDPSAEAMIDAITARMAAAFPDASVIPDPAVEQTLNLPDPADTHVLAAAIAAGASVLLTFNLQDFPVGKLAGHGILRRHPDEFLWEILSGEPEIVGRIVRVTAAEFGLTDTGPIRNALKRARLSRFAKAWFAMESSAG